MRVTFLIYVPRFYLSSFPRDSIPYELWVFVRTQINAAEGMRIQYGGSMKGANAAGLLAQKDIDGGLIGGAGLKANTITEIIAAAEAK